jgi:hypothetical protein
MEVDKRFLAARIAGEMKPSDIPVAPGVNLDELKKDDNDPLEVVVEVPEGKSTRGWYYTGESLKNIVDKVNSNTLAGFLGHQEPEKVATEFPPPVTHWIGAKWENGKAYFRGVIDKVASDLKRWIRSGRVRQVSIFGIPKLKTVNGETLVTGYNALSIDWTPLDRAGMPTRIVAVGEVDSTFGDSLGEEMDGSHEDPRFVPVGEMEGDDVEMKLEEMLAAIRSAVAKGEMTLETVLGEIGYTKEQVVDLFAGEQMKSLQTAREAGTKIVAALGFPKDLPVEEAVSIAGEMAAVWKSLGFDKNKPEDVTTVAGEMANLYSEKATASLKSRIDKIVENKVTGKEAQGFFTGLLSRTFTDASATDEMIASELDNLLNDENIKALISNQFVDQSPGVGGSTGTQGSSKQNVRVKTVSL